MSRSPHMKSCLFLSWNIHTVVFFFLFLFPNFCFSVCSYVVIVVTVISLSLLFLMYSAIPLIDASKQPSILTSLLSSSFLDTYCLSIISPRWKTLYILINFLVLWSIFLSSSLIHFVNSPVLLLLLLLLFSFTFGFLQSFTEFSAMT